ncbi:MAG: hypothetical protein QGI68_15145 [Pseudomonadales bacterium]|jgi:hypothetical protein|nr:hypothetical protein [Pseudomonadales bacterium]MDP7596884.1 hypothetical protein [Pseudomonadales bacterium]HJN51709.1 hypothetical protein [Pseudomonadales bacterium]|tara:strand:- start:166 stop:1035 length:870 start_codon:yes stop_codon:yes gene_type:complete
MYMGPWVMVRKPPSSKETIARGVKPRTLIHDDDAARALGFKSGIVGGLTLMSVTTGAIPAGLGHRWFEGGAYSVRHRNVSYEGEVRVIWDMVPGELSDYRRITFHLENRRGETSTHGWAATAEPGGQLVAPWETPRTVIGNDASPDVVIGTTRDPFEIIVRREDVMEKDQQWWYHIASPFGDPILSPLDIASVFYHGRRINPAFVEPKGPVQVSAGMDAGTDLVVYEPLFLDRNYVIETRTADKWQTKKTVFTSTEYAFTDKKSGRLVAISRNYGARMIGNPVPVAPKK